MGTTTQPPGATAYDTPERPRARDPKPPLLRYEEDCPTINVVDVDEKYCLTGYGDISVSEHYDVVETGEDDQRLRVPRLKHIRPRAQHQTAKAVSDRFQPEFLRNTIHATSTDPPDTPNTDFKEFFENLLRKTPPTRRKRTLTPSTSLASEAVDAPPRSN